VIANTALPNNRQRPNLSKALVVHSAVYDEPLVLSRDTFTSHKQSQLGVNQRSTFNGDLLPG